MKYLLLVLGIVFFTACTPKYKIIHTYSAPQSEGAKACVATCQEKLATCKALCKANFDVCKIKAEQIGKRRYNEKLKSYYQALENYANQVQQYNMDREFYFYNDFYYYGGPYGYRGPFGPYWTWGPPTPMYTLRKPVKPNLEQEIQLAQMQHCQIDCKCQNSYEQCFQSCGGKVISKKVCIENCPNE